MTPRFTTSPRPTRRLERALGAILFSAMVFGGTGCGDSTGPLITAWKATLVAVRPYEVRGRAAALTQAGRTQATISIEGADSGVPHAWRIERGTCAAPGELQGGPASYPVLLPGGSGSASAEASIANLFHSGQSFIVRVLRSPEGETPQTAACAAFVETAP